MKWPPRSSMTPVMFIKVSWERRRCASYVCALDTDSATDIGDNRLPGTGSVRRG